MATMTATASMAFKIGEQLARLDGAGSAAAKAAAR
jgi:hypothetical protein